MPARPLFSVKRNAEIDLKTDPLRKYPELAALVAYVITDWTRVEASLGQVLLAMLGARAKSTAFMYASLKSPQAKADTLSLSLHEP